MELIIFKSSLGFICKVDFVGNVPLVGTPNKKYIKNFNTILFLHDPEILQLVILSHLLSMIFYKFVNVLTKKIHSGLC
jgi:hypothetical protein